MYGFINSPSDLKVPTVPSISLPHHPEGHATTWRPCSSTVSVTFSGNVSPQVPSSPRDLHLIHRLSKPVTLKIFCNYIVCTNFLIYRKIILMQNHSITDERFDLIARRVNIKSLRHIPNKLLLNNSHFTLINKVVSKVISSENLLWTSCTTRNTHIVHKNTLLYFIL